MTAETSFDPRTGGPVTRVPVSSTAEVDQVVAAAVAVAPAVAAVSPHTRRGWSYAIAEALVAEADLLARLADTETGLGHERLQGEVLRTAGQLRAYADAAVEGSYLAATLDSRTDLAPALARVGVPLGPVAVFGASNFPFAFSTLGNDTASAIAAGCPVVVKAHPAHLSVGRQVLSVATAALDRAGAPAGLIGAVHGLEAGSTLVSHPDIAAVAFTGSQVGGMSLWRLANEREVVIPVFAEMGTVNPVVVTPSRAPDLAAVAEGFVGSFTLGSGQFCTKPGLLLVPRGHGGAGHVAAALRAAAPSPVMLTEGIAEGLRRDIDEMIAAGAVLESRIDGPSAGFGAPAAVLSCPAGLVRAGSRVVEECFGAVALVVEYDDVGDAVEILGRLQGALAGSVFAGADDPDAPAVLGALQRKVGRVILDGWPTGVAFTPAQHHGGPWPATSTPSATSVGAGALARFVRPVAYQDLTDDLLPPTLQAGNPWGITRWVDGLVHRGGA